MTRKSPTTNTYSPGPATHTTQPAGPWHVVHPYEDQFVSNTDTAAIPIVPAATDTPAPPCAPESSPVHHQHNTPAPDTTAPPSAPPADADAESPATVPHATTQGYVLLAVATIVLGAIVYAAAWLMQSQGITEAATPTAPTNKPLPVYDSGLDRTPSPKVTKVLKPFQATDATGNVDQLTDVVQRQSARITSPGSNLNCDMSPAGVWCSAPAAAIGAQGFPASCPDGEVPIIGLIETPTVTCGTPLPTAATASTDSSLSMGGYICVTDDTGIHCKREATGAGFSITERAVRLT